MLNNSHNKLLLTILIISIIITSVLFASCTNNDNMKQNSTFAVDELDFETVNNDSLEKKLTAREWYGGEMCYVFYKEGSFKGYNVWYASVEYEGDWYIEEDTNNLVLSTPQKTILTYKDISGTEENVLDLNEWNVTSDYLYINGQKYYSKNDPNYIVQFTEAETEAPKDAFEKFGLEYELDENDINIVRDIYTQIQNNYMTLQDSNTEKYTRYPLDINQLCFVYFGEYPIVVGYYPIESKMITSTWKIHENGTLTDIDFDMDEYTAANKNESGFIDMSTITNAVPFGQRYGEESNIKWLCYTYAEYKEKRQEKYGDLLENSDSILEDLNDSQKEMLDNILKYSSIWENYYSSWEGKNYPCIYISIWSFGDGSAEILCTNGTVDFHNDKSTQYRGNNHGYSISKDGCMELDDSASERLERDLSSQDKLYWSNDWIHKTKEIKLAKYILEIS